MGANACKAAYDADPKACVTGPNTQCLVRDGDDGACSCYIFRHTSGASIAGFEDSCGYLPLAGDKDYHNAVPPANYVNAKGTVATRGLNYATAFGSDPGDRTYGQMMNLGMNAGTWAFTCESFSLDVVKNDLDPEHADRVYCYTQTDPTIFGIASAQYAQPCVDCDDGTADNTYRANVLNDTLIGQLLEGASEGVAMAVDGFTLDTGVERAPSTEEQLASPTINAALLVTSIVKAV